MKEKLKWYNKGWVYTIIAVVIVIIVVVSSFVYYIWANSKSFGPVGALGIMATIKKDDNNWICLITSPSRSDIDINYSTLVIKREELTLVSFTFDDKQASDPTNIDPLTNNITNYDIYTLSKEGYTIYFYNANKGVFSGIDKFYIVNNGLRSGDIFEIRWYRKDIGQTCTLFSGSLP